MLFWAYYEQVTQYEYVGHHFTSILFTCSDAVGTDMQT